MTRPKTILAIDDDDSLRRVVEYNLMEEGYRVITAADGPSGLRAYQRQPVDVVLTDIRMPGMEGIELLARLKAMQPELPVIMLTAFGTIDSAVEAMRLGAFDYLTKPFSRDQLRVSVRKALEVAELRSENRQLREVVSERFSFANMIAGSRAMRAVSDTASRVAQTDTTVLLVGESGTGKELLARAIHFNSGRARGAFGVIGLGDLPDRLRTPVQRIGNVRIELPDEGISLENVERELILTALEKHDWNQTRAAAYLDITRSTLLYRMQKYGLEREKAPAEAAPEESGAGQ